MAKGRSECGSDWATAFHRAGVLKNAQRGALLDIPRDCRIFFAVLNSHPFDRFPCFSAGVSASREETYG